MGPVPNYVTALTFSSNGDVITGDSGGDITVWSRDDSDVFQINRRASENLINAHPVGFDTPEFYWPMNTVRMPSKESA